MAYDLEEQEKIASLKAWWERYGSAVTTVVVAAAVAFAGFNAWQWYQRNHAMQAAGAYDELERAVAVKDIARTRDLAGTLLDKYGSTAYAEMAALLSAKANLETGDAKTAKAQLQWVIDHARDAEYRALGRIRLAGVLLDEGAYDDATKLVSEKAAADLSAPFQAAFADRRGDIAVAQNRLEDARREYRAALKALSRSDARGYATVIELKLEGLSGGVPVAAASPPAPANLSSGSASTAAPASPTGGPAPAKPPAPDRAGSEKK